MSDPAILAAAELEAGETVVEIYARLLTHLDKDGLSGRVASIIPPIVHVMENGKYVAKGTVVNDPEILGQMDIPDHETCVFVARVAMAALA